MGSKIPTYIGYGVILWFVWTNFGSTISAVLGTASGFAGEVGGFAGDISGRSGTYQAPTTQNRYYRG